MNKLLLVNNSSSWRDSLDKVSSYHQAREHIASFFLSRRHLNVPHGIANLTLVLHLEERLSFSLNLLRRVGRRWGWFPI